MSEESRTQLKTYFETGDKPTEAQFINLIDSLLNILDDGELVSATNSITAYAGGGQGSATLLSTEVNNVSVVASDNDSVKLPVAIPGMLCFVHNEVAKILDIFPNTGAHINDLGSNLAVEITEEQTGFFYAVTSTYWKFYALDSNSATAKQYANIYSVSGATTNLTINTPAKINWGSTTEGDSSGDFTFAENQITYTGTETRSFMMLVSISGKINIVDTNCEFSIFKSGTVINASVIQAKVFTANHLPYAIVCVDDVAQNEYLEVYIENVTSNNDFQSYSLNFLIKEI